MNNYEESPTGGETFFTKDWILYRLRVAMREMEYSMTENDFQKHVKDDELNITFANFTWKKEGKDSQNITLTLHIKKITV